MQPGIVAAVVSSTVAAMLARHSVFQLALPHGLCVGVPVPADGLAASSAGGAAGDGAGRAALDAMLAQLDGAEARHAWALGPARRRTWVAGRVAMRAALAELGLSRAELLPDDRGAPRMPAGVVGSISHKRDLAVAMVAEAGRGSVGVDLEQRMPRASGIDISRRVLAPDEQAELAGLGSAERGAEVMLRFSLKEAIYKAIDPFLRRYVGFAEVSVSPRADGSATVRQHLRPGERLEIEAWWQAHGDVYVLTSARARRL